MDTKLNLDLLQTLVAVAETGELKKAAERVFKSHSAVSMQIQRLEKIAGTAVIDRSSRGVTLTEKGQVLLSYGKQLLQLNTAALAALKDDDLSGKMTFGIPTDYAQIFITRLLPLLQAKLPNLQATIVCGRSRSLRKKILSGSLDIAVVAGENSTPEEQDEQFLWSEQLNWVASPDFQVNEDEALPVAVFNDNCIVKDLCLDGLRKATISYRTVFSSPVLDNIADAVYNGIGVSLLPESLAPGSKTRILPRHILSCSDPLTINLISASSMDESVVNSVAGYVKSVFRDGIGN